MQITILVSALAALSWLLVVAFLVLTVLRARQGRKTRGTVTGIIIAVVAAIILNTASAGLVFIEPQERGVVTSAIAPKGYREAILQPGLRWVIPYAENVTTYSISKNTYTMSIATQEGDIKGDDSIAARTADGVYDEWVRRSFAALAKLMPARYAKTERSENVVMALY